MSNNEVRIQDDLYQAVNGEWLETAVIPDDRPTTGGFAELDQILDDFLLHNAGAVDGEDPFHDTKRTSEPEDTSDER